jgi:hypothetical protein
MQLLRTTKALAFTTMLSIGALSLPALAADGDAMQSFQRDVQTMANKDGMVSKKDFLAMMEKKFDAMDKGKKGMLSVSDVMRIFSDKTGQ